MPKSRVSSKTKPSKRSSEKKHSKIKRPQPLIGNRFFKITVIMLVLMFTVSIAAIKADYSPLTPLKQITAPSEDFNFDTSTNKDKKLRTFTGEAFAQIYDSTVWRNTIPYDQSISITGNADADRHILAIALQRGYSFTPVPQRPLDYIEGKQLQDSAMAAWEEMKIAAASEAVGLIITRGYYSPEEQAADFKSLLTAERLTAEDIVSGAAEAQLDRILSSTALPGLSRHHTGYVVDIGCISDNALFEESACYRWLSKDNYSNAKKFGWIPSSPPGAGLQGSDPQYSEFIWVGSEALYE